MKTHSLCARRNRRRNRKRDSRVWHVHGSRECADHITKKCITGNSPGQDAHAAMVLLTVKKTNKTYLHFVAFVLTMNCNSLLDIINGK